MIGNLGPYQILEEIGRGGMGTVYKAYHPALDRHVAIKVLPSRFVGDPTFVDRFKKEAQTIARLEHPHILPVYDFAYDGSTAYLVMKLVNGHPLTDYIKPGGMNPERAMRILEAASEAMAHAHRRNIIHRDVKPDNILIDENEWVYLTDFGMAKIANVENPTSEGFIMGTPEYMAPEQAQGKAVDFRADIYSFAVLIFHMLTGTIPYRGKQVMETIFKVINEPFPRVTDRNPSLPKLLDSLLQKGAAKNPQDRFSDVTELVKMVGALLTTISLPDTQEITISKHRLAIVPFSASDSSKPWMGDAIQELLSFDLAQSHELYVLSGDQVTRMYRNLAQADSKWAAGPLQRFFELSRADYMIHGSVTDQGVHYEIKISTTFETIDQGTVEGSIPFHLASVISQKIKAKLQVKETKVISVEQIFHGNLALLQYYASGVRAYRDGIFLNADESLRMALTQEPAFAPAHMYLACALEGRGLKQQSAAEAQASMLYTSTLPTVAAALLRAQYFGFVGRSKEAAQIFKTFHEQFPDVIEYLVQWGEALVKAEQLDEAATVFFEICEKEAKSGLGWQRLAWIEFLQDKYEQAWFHYKRAERLFAARDHVGGIAASYEGLAQIAEQRGEWSTAIDYYTRASEAFTRLHWLKGMANSRYHLALALRQQNTRADVPKLLREALDLFQKIGDVHGESQSLKELLEEALPAEEAATLSDRALALASEMQDANQSAMLVPLKLRWLNEAGQFDAALQVYTDYYQLLLKQSPELHFPASQVEVTRALMQQGRRQEAEVQIDQALRTFSHTGHSKALARATLVRSELFLQQKQLSEAQTYIDEAGGIAENLSDKELALDTEMIRARLLEEQHQKVRLLQVYLRILKLADELGRTTISDEIKARIDQLKL